MVTICDRIQWNQLLNRFQAERKNFSNELNDKMELPSKPSVLVIFVWRVEDSTGIMCRIMAHNGTYIPAIGLEYTPLIHRIG